jgi:hydrogenase/urease accessory protein HupE
MLAFKPAQDLKKYRRLDSGTNGGEKTMLIKFARLTEVIAGYLLGSLAVSMPVGNILICVFVILFGPAFILGFLA